MTLYAITGCFIVEAASESEADELLGHALDYLTENDGIRGIVWSGDTVPATPEDLAELGIENEEDD